MLILSVFCYIIRAINYVFVVLKVMLYMSDRLIDNKELMKEWNQEKNILYNPADLTSGSSKKVWWKCKNGHEWEAEFAIVKGNTVLGNLMDDVRFYGELALIREGIEKIHDALPDYKYVPMRDVREAMYPEKMTTEQLAEALDEIAEAFDPYEYRDNVYQQVRPS